MRLTIRTACERDLPAIGRIQSASPGASQWNPADYLRFDCRVAEQDGSVVGFAVARAVTEREWEILNLAVAPAARRKGIGRRLLTETLAMGPGEFFLEVRESNTAARQFYESLGFELVTKRLRYYADPDESAIVMKFHS